MRPVPATDPPCPACVEGLGNQEAHTEPGGCLWDPTEWGESWREGVPCRFEPGSMVCLSHCTVHET
jgi:hypothetical protein